MLENLQMSRQNFGYLFTKVNIKKGKKLNDCQSYASSYSEDKDSEFECRYL